LSGKFGGVGDNLSHAYCDARLRQQRQSQIIAHVFVRLDHCRARKGSEIFAHRPENDVGYAGYSYQRNNFQVKLRARNDEKQHIKGRRPIFGTVKDLQAVFSHVGKDSSRHHAGQKGGQGQSHRPIHFRQPYARKNGDYHQAQSVCARPEKPHAKRKQRSQSRSDNEGQSYFEKGSDHGAHKGQLLAYGKNLCQRDAY
jgi:hypothetical protein